MDALKEYNLTNGNIVTLNPNYPKAKSLTVKNNIIHSIDSVDSSLESINLEGATVLPGLVDSHFHLSNFGKRLEMINLKGLKSINDVRAEVSKKVSELGPRKFIHGFGWDQTLWRSQEYPEDDILNHFPSHIKLRLDFNGRLDLSRSIRLCKELKSYNIDYIEQPAMK